MTLVIKIGTNTLTTPQGSLDLNLLRHLVDQIASFHEQHDCLIVTSAAVTCGSQLLGITPKSVQEKQAAAAVGQPRLMYEYERFFETKGILVAQILLTRDVFEQKERSENTFNTMTMLLKKRVIPIINENDTVAIEELKFGDNDELSSKVSVLMKADLLVLLTDIDGLFTENPKLNPKAKQIFEVKKWEDRILDMGTGPVGTRSLGGMTTKLKAAKWATEHGIKTAIANGRIENVLIKILNQEKIGTLFYPQTLIKRRKK